MQVQAKFKYSAAINPFFRQVCGTLTHKHAFESRRFSGGHQVLSIATIRSAKSPNRAVAGGMFPEPRDCVIPIAVRAPTVIQQWIPSALRRKSSSSVLDCH